MFEDDIEPFEERNGVHNDEDHRQLIGGPDDDDVDDVDHDDSKRQLDMDDDLRDDDHDDIDTDEPPPHVSALYIICFVCLVMGIGIVSTLIVQLLNRVMVASQTMENLVQNLPDQKK